MSTKMGFWRGALAGAAVLLAVGTASARVIDPTGVTTNESAAIVLYPKLKVDLNTCGGAPDADIAARSTRASACGPATMTALSRRRLPDGGRRHAGAADQHLGVPDQGALLLHEHQQPLQQRAGDDLHGRELPLRVSPRRSLRAGLAGDRLPSDADEASADLVVGQPGPLVPAACDDSGPGQSAAVQRGQHPAGPRGAVHGRAALHPGRRDDRAADRPQRPQG